jgi:hypothetical protein
MLSCDLFVFLDDVLHSKRAITSKNKIKAPEGVRLLSVPLANKEVLIKDLIIHNGQNWHQKHWNSLTSCYSRSPFWKEYRDKFAPVFAHPGTNLVELNLSLLSVIKDILEIATPVVRSSQIPALDGKKGTRIINICRHFGASTYLSGTGARAYNDELEFTENNIRLVYQSYKISEYPQLWNNFIPNLSVVDLLFNCGPESKKYLVKQVI